MPTLFVPYVVKAGESLDSILKELLDLILLASWQQRKGAKVHPLLMKAAQKKAQDMVDKNYFGHTSPDGVSANQNVLSVGYPLPDWYTPEKNSVESLGLGYGNPKSVVAGWLSSPKHRAHVAGELDFYRNQLNVGVGMAINKEKRPLWVFLSAH